MKNSLLLILALLIPAVAFAATRDLSFSWEQELLTVDGDPIEQMGGFRLFLADGTLIQEFPGDARNGGVRYNLPWGEACFKMRSFYTINGIEYESDDSNVGACTTINPGRPVPPVVQ